MGGPSAPAVPQQAQPLPELQPFVQKAGQYLASQVGQPAQPYPGPFAAPTDPAQAAATSYVSGLGAEEIGSGATPTSLDALVKIASGSTLPGASPYLNQIAQALSALTGISTEKNVSDIESRYGATGNAMSSEAARAVGDARTSSTAGLANTLGQLGLSAYNTGVGQQLQAAQSGLQYAPNLANLLFSQGTQGQNVQQQGVTNALAELARVEQSPYTAIQIGEGVIPTSAQYPQYSPSAAPGIIGGLASLLTAPIKGSGLGALLGIV